MPLFGSLAGALGSAIKRYSDSNRTSGSSGGSTGTRIGSYTYSRDNTGNVYKDGRLVAPENYKYVPQSFLSGGASGGTSGGTTSQKIGSYTYSKDASGNVYKDGRLVSPDNYKYIPQNFLGSPAPKTDVLRGIGTIMDAGANWLGNIAKTAGENMASAMQTQTVPYQEIPYQSMPMQEELGAIIGQLQDLSSQSFDSGSAAMIDRAYKDTLAQIDAAQAQLIGQMQQQMGGVDPATVQSLKAIRDSVEQNRKGLMDEMSKRGLLQSGIWLEEENKLNSAQMTAEQQLLANRLSELQTQLNNALMGFGNMRVNAASNKSQQELQALQNEAAMKQNALQSGLATAIDLYKNNQNYALNEFSTTAPYYMQTISDAKRSVLDDASTFGQQGDYSSDPYYKQAGSPSSNMVSVREYVGNKGTVEWDKNNGAVIVNGQAIETPQIVNGRAMVDQATLDRILGR